MARQVLENGVVLPAEYSDDWYDDMTSNLTKLDDVIGSDSEKLSSSDVGAAALSNNYNDLDNLPTIPTVNDATLTIQKNGVDVQTFTANASSNVTCNITVPTKTSDLTNDSNFVDSSNAAVASGITSAKVTSYDSHVADTDIHVTTADKNKWNNNITQSYVFRYSSTALVASSTNSNTLLDNTDNLKIGDKVIDSSGVLFSITAIDTQNSTFTIGTALIDLAQDSDVVHKSGDEAISGIKTFGNGTLIVNNTMGSNVHGEIKLNGSRTGYIVADNSSDGVFSNNNCGVSILLQDENKPLHIGGYKVDSNGRIFVDNTNKKPVLSITGGLIKTSTLVPENDTSNCLFRILSQLDYANGNPSKTLDVRFIQYDNVDGSSAIYSNDDGKTLLGATSKRWSKVYAMSYYYGNDNVEFSTKFVTTDTNQTISGNKTFSSNVNVYNSDSSTDTANIVLKNSKAERGSTTNIGEQTILFLDKDNAQIGNIKCEVESSGVSILNIQCTNSSNSSSGIRLRRTSTGTFLQPSYNYGCNLGTNSYRWYDVQTRAVNNLEPSSLSLPSGNVSDVIDISSYLVNLDGTDNTYVAPANGWITIKASTATGISCTIPNLWNDSRIRTSAGGLRMLFPILKGQTVYISIYATTLDMARFIPCQGNV